MRITMAQLNPVIGDFKANFEKLTTVVKDEAKNTDIILFSELYPSGYPPRDWLCARAFLSDYEQANSEIIGFSRGFPDTALLFGTIIPSYVKTGKGLYNAAMLVKNGTVIFKQLKSLLPSYDIFDETRYFDTAPSVSNFRFLDETLGILICEDAWNDDKLFPEYAYQFNPVKAAAQNGATFLINISASPYSVAKDAIRHELFSKHAKRRGLPFLLLNQTGGNDELICDGSSMVFDNQGHMRLHMPAFKENVLTIDSKKLPEKRKFTPANQTESVYNALIAGTKDYMEKCGFKKAVLGLSGGIDSALTCVLAARALGPENVSAVYMPSQYSSEASGEDASKLAHNLGVHFTVIPIMKQFEAFKSGMAESFAGLPENETEENMQARIRGNILMALSNKFGYLTLASGNKSELSVGYCTLYGDMCGGLSVIGDCYKTMVYSVCKWINRNEIIIPERILTRPPSAELKPDQTDQDTLPPYDILDSILEKYLEKNMTCEEIISCGFDKNIVEWIINAVQKNEYKRLQAPPVLRITGKAFGSGRRIPVAARWRPVK